MNLHAEDAQLIIHRATDEGYPFEIWGPGGESNNKNNKNQ